MVTKRLVLWLPIVTVLGLLVLVATGLWGASSSPDGTKSSRDGESPTRARVGHTDEAVAGGVEPPAPLIENGEPVLHLGAAGDAKTYTSIEDIPADAVVVLTPVKELSEYWLPLRPQIWVWSRWEVRVDQVLRGSLKQGDSITVAILGGHVNQNANLSVASGELEGSARPVPGEPTTLVAYDDWPRLVIGRPELMFLKDWTDYPDAGPTWLLAAFEGRMLVGVDGSLISPLPDRMRRLPVLKEIESMGTDGLRARLAGSP